MNSLSLTKEELKDIEKAAEAARRTFSDYVRLACDVEAGKSSSDMPEVGENLGRPIEKKFRATAKQLRAWKRAAKVWKIPLPWWIRRAVLCAARGASVDAFPITRKPVVDGV